MKKLNRLAPPVVAASAIVAVLMLSLAALRPATAQPPAPGEKQAQQITTSTDAAYEKMSPTVRDAAKAGGEAVIGVIIDANMGVDVTPYAVKAVTAKLPRLDSETILAQVKGSALTKIASLPGVNQIAPVVPGPSETHRPPIAPDQSPKPSLEQQRVRIEELRKIARPWDASQEPAAAKPQGWFDVGPNQESRRAWMKGYQGQGVKIAVIDSGVDMAHPDFWNTWATVDDPESPYVGWPMAFDPYSMLLYWSDANFDTDFVATGAAWYADTTATPQVFRSFEDLQNGTARARYATFADSPGRGSKTPGVSHEYKFKDTSMSGVYHFGSHPDLNLAHVFGQSPAVLLVDEHQPGVYDTVYVDLDNDYDFTNEKPVTKASPLSYRDMDGDGKPDISGGGIYWIADGTNPIPGSDVLYGDEATPPAKASLVAFMGSFDDYAGADYGTRSASNAVGQGAINGFAPRFQDLPNGPSGVTLGGAPKAKLVPIGDINDNFDTSMRQAWYLSLMGYDGIPNSADDIQITSNGYFTSATANSGWDYYSRLLDRMQRRLNPTTSFVFGAGNSGPGYGTAWAPLPSVAIKVGASLEMGSTGWDSITRTGQITYGSMGPFSSRGPDARGTVGADVAADGGFASGDLPINVGFNGNYSWATWDAPQRAASVAAGNLALVYQAFKAKNDRWPTSDEGRVLLKAGAVTTGADVFAAGAGRINADLSTDIASGRQGIYALPDQWRVGDYHGKEYPAFANIIYPGANDTQSFSLSNPSDHAVDVTLSADALRRFDGREFTFTSKPISEESPRNFFAPDYLMPLDNIPDDTEMMQVSAIYPMSQFDPTGTGSPTNGWYLVIYDWTDINGDGKLWTDTNGNGVANHQDAVPFQPANIDGVAPRDFYFTRAALDWSKTEFERWEFERVSYTYSAGNTMKVQMFSPKQKMHDGLYIGFRHPYKMPEVPTTTIQVKIDFYKRQPWEWANFSSDHLTIQPHSTATATATIAIPTNTAAGEYEGAIHATSAGRAPYGLFLPLVAANARLAGPASLASPSAEGRALEIPDRVDTIPVVASVAAQYNFSGAITLGGAKANDPTDPYNNGVVRGDFDWAFGGRWWGDRRTYFVDATQTPISGTKLLTRNVWADASPPTDIDTTILGPASDRFSDPSNPGNADVNWADPAYYGPYTLDRVGGSLNTYVDPGFWRFQTATGGAEEWVAGEAAAGLHAIRLHNVLFDGDKFDVPYTTTVGAATVSPSAISVTRSVTTTTTISNCTPLTFSATLDLPGLTAEGFGLSKPEVRNSETAHQDNPNDPGSASYKRAFTVTHASRLTVSIDGGIGPDLDLFLLRDGNGDGKFTSPDEVVAASTTSTAQESVSLTRPVDGAYEILVHGYSVPGGSATFRLTLDLVQGFDVTVRGVPNGPLAANTPAHMQVCYKKTVSPGEVVQGDVLLGPSVAPSTFTVPIVIKATTP
ncbi:MAG: S8 family serine peptidase [Anaerolineae bacterium]